MWDGIKEVIDQYKGFANYDYALARSMLGHAGDLLSSNKQCFLLVFKSYKEGAFFDFF